MGRIYKNTKECLNELRREMKEMGTIVSPFSYQNKIVKDDDNFITRELQGYEFTIIDTSDAGSLSKDKEWADAEFIERISRKECNPGEAYKLRDNGKFWSQFADEKGEQDYTYSDRMKNQIDRIITELKRNPDTRQAIITIYNSDKDIDSIGGKKRTPCSMHYHLMIRKDGNGIPKMNIIYVMRSCDLSTHFVNDIYLASKLRNYIAKEVGVESGTYTMFISSFHQFKKDWNEGVY